MLSENGDVFNTTGRQTTRLWVSKMADRRYHVASLLIEVVVWTGENDTKTISVDTNLFENGANRSVLVWKRISVDRALAFGFPTALVNESAAANQTVWCVK